MCIVDEWWQMRWNVDVQYREDVMLRCWQCRDLERQHDHNGDVAIVGDYLQQNF